MIHRGDGCGIKKRRAFCYCFVFCISFWFEWIYGDYFPRLYIKYGFDLNGKNTHSIVCKQCPIGFRDDQYDSRRRHPGVTSRKIGQSIRVEVCETEYLTVEYCNVERGNYNDVEEFACQTRKRRKNAKGDAPWTEASALNNTNVKWVWVDPYYDCLCHIVFFGISRKHAIAPLFLWFYIASLYCTWCDDLSCDIIHFIFGFVK